MVRNYTIKKAKCKIWQEHKKMHPFHFLNGMGKRPVFFGAANLQFLGPEFITNHKKCLQGKKDAIFG